MLITIMLTGGAVYMGLQVYPILTRIHPQYGARQITPWSAYLRRQQTVMPAAVEVNDSLMLEQKIQQGLHLSLAALGLTAAGALLYPPLGYAGALLVVYLDLPFLVEAILDLVQEKRIGMSLLYSLVRTVALVEGAYLANALDVWLYYWTRQRLLQAERTVEQHFHDSFRRPPRTVWVVRDVSEIKIPLSEVETGEIVLVQAGEVIPVDGVIMQGAALLSQPFLCETASSCPVSVGTHVLACSCVLAGKIQVAVERSGEQTQAAQLEQWVKHTANGQTDWQSFGEQLADQMAIPMVGVGALAAFALGPLGGITILNAKLGYDTSVLAPLALRRLVTMAYQKGILIKDSRVLEQVHQVDTVVFSLDAAPPTTGRPLDASDGAAGLIPVVQALRQRNLTVICLLSADLPHALPQWATDLGVKTIFITATEDVAALKANVIEQLRATHHVVCYVGNGLTDAHVMQKADVAVSWCGGVDLANDAAQVVFLDQCLNHLSQLFDLGHSFNASLGAAFLLTLTPGLLSIACAFLPNVGFATSLLLENAGLLAGLYTVTQLKPVTASHAPDAGKATVGERLLPFLNCDPALTPAFA